MSPGDDGVNIHNDDEEDNGVVESFSFSAKVHYNHIIDVMETFYQIDTKKWITNQTADNASVNESLARLLSVPHVTCVNHL